MTDAELTQGEIARAVKRLESKLDTIDTKLDDLTGKVVSDFYRLEDHERRLSRLEKALVTVASVVIVAILSALIDLALH